MLKKEEVYVEVKSEPEARNSQQYEDIVKFRRTGRTVRQVDKAVQELFTKGVCHLECNHSPLGNVRESNKRLLEMLLSRLQAEHRLSKGKDLEIVHLGDFFKVCLKS